MKLYCFVILIFISVIFTVGEVREWGNGGIRGVYSLPTSTTNQNEVISNSDSQPLLARRSLVPEDTVVDVDKKLNTTDTTDNSEDPKSPKHPSQTPQIDNGDKAKHVDSSIQSQNTDNKQTAEKLEEEAQTIKKVIVVLCSLGASLLLVAIAIAVLYWKVRRQQQALNKNKSSLKGSSRGGDTSGNTGSSGNNINGDDNNNDGNVKRDSGSGVGGETSDSISLVTAPLIMGEKINSSDSLVGVNNGVIVCDKVSNDGSNIQYTKMPTILEQLPPPVRPSAPPEDKFDTDLDNNINGSNLSFSTPPITAPPAYSPIAPPTAPPIYALPFIPIPEFDDPIELYNYQSTQQNSHNLETNSNDNGIVSPVYNSDSLPPNNGVLYAAGPTSQTDTSVDYTSNQQTSHSTIIHSSSTVDLNSSSNSHENNDDRPTHQRHNSSTI